MDTTNNDAAFWIAGYTDYLRDVVGAADTTPVALLAHRTTLHRDLFRLGCPRLDRFVRPAGDRVHPGGGRTQERARPHGTCERHALLLAIPGLARCCSERARPRYPEDPARTACQPADAPLLGATRAVVAASSRAWSGGVS